MISMTSSLCLLPRRSGGRLRCGEEDKTNLYAFNQKPPYQTLYALLLLVCFTLWTVARDFNELDPFFFSLYLWSLYSIVYIHSQLVHTDFAIVNSRFLFIYFYKMIFSGFYYFYNFEMSVTKIKAHV